MKSTYLSPSMSLTQFLLLSVSLDLDFPIECDDEYWVTPDPALAFRQPEGKPSLVAYFNCQLRLNQINAFALRTIVSETFMLLQWFCDTFL